MYLYLTIFKKVTANIVVTFIIKHLKIKKQYIFLLFSSIKKYYNYNGDYMKEKYEKYAELLLSRCLNTKGEPLVIMAPIESIEFIRILQECALKRGTRDIYYDWYDDNLKYSQLKYYDKKDIEKSLFWNKSIYDEYVKKNASFLLLIGEDPDIMNDIDSKKLDYSAKLSRTSKPLYRKGQDNNTTKWCIASVSSYGWAKKVFNDSKDSVNKLWDLIFDICLVNTENPIEEWNKKSKLIKKRCDSLNRLNIKTLHYTNSIGTDLYIGLSKNTKWLGADEEICEQQVICNMPTEEIFTSPNRNMTRGIVKASKPLVYNGYIIDDFWIKFNDGKVVDFDAKKGKKILEGIIKGDENSCYLGECALVPFDSPISNSNVLFYETLFDENASCHIALGTGFPSCIDGNGKEKEELLSLGLNVSTVHVDFMIGTQDLKIEGITYDNENVVIFDNGNFYNI